MIALGRRGLADWVVDVRMVSGRRAGAISKGKEKGNQILGVGSLRGCSTRYGTRKLMGKKKVRWIIVHEFWHMHRALLSPSGFLLCSSL